MSRREARHASIVRRGSGTPNPWQVRGIGCAKRWRPHGELVEIIDDPTLGQHGKPVRRIRHTADAGFVLDFSCYKGWFEVSP